MRIERNIENGNGYCIGIDYDDDNEEVDEEEVESVQGTRRQLFNMALILLG